ncbi:prolyl oligopeptidase family serine peptidase [Lusitaniella coriacea]|uniref:S9 family peptidase n=1 Tax=Lusitaniella coriacea TaxID=1983105 RepID=UPI003CF7ED80
MKQRLFLPWVCLFLVTFWSAIAMTPSSAQLPWQSPPKPIDQILNTPLPPASTLSPNHRWFVEVERPPFPPLTDLAQPKLSLAGLQINPKTNGPANRYTFGRLTYRALPDGKPQTPNLPEDARLSFFNWSTDGERLAFALERETGWELWMLDLPSGKTQSLSEPILNATYGTPCRWLPGDEGLICKIVPDDRGAPPEAPSVPSGPAIEENLGRKAPARTYTNLLKNPQDEALFEYYLTSRLEKISLTRDRTPILPPTLIDDAIPSPNGESILLSTLHRPFSYQVPLSRFPKTTQVVNLQDKSLYTVAELPLADNIPIKFGSVRPGRREISWRADRAATLYWIEALDGGDAAREVAQRDALVELPSPFTAEPQTLWKSEYRFDDITWGREDTALVSEWWYDNRKSRIWKINPQNPTLEPQLIIERNYQDRYSDPGTPLTTLGDYGKRVLRFARDRESLYFEGRGASESGVYPFLDRRSLATGKTERLWQAKNPYYERIEDIIDDRASQIVTRRQSKIDPPNFFIVRRTEPSKSLQLTDYQDPAPQFTQVGKEVIQYERADGVKLTATLYLPPNYDPEKDGALPTIFWVYPEEFKDAATAGQITTAENAFSRPYGSSVLFLLLRGYAVLDNPTLPIIGEGDREPNDTYVEQLLMGAEAAVREVVRRGVSDPQRLVIGGHSYGAFTAANLLAHSDLFQAGIARSGAYNRTLTPFGFQGEQRNFWEATQIYMQMSPFTHAAKINEPLLLIHGADDNNSGTYPVQSERFYEALKGLGGTVRWVELPYEGHGYRSRESIGHVLWEMVRWCDRYT